MASQKIMVLIDGEPCEVAVMESPCDNLIEEWDTFAATLNVSDPGGNSAEGLKTPIRKQIETSESVKRPRGRPRKIKDTSISSKKTPSSRVKSTSSATDTVTTPKYTIEEDIELLKQLQVEKPWSKENDHAEAWKTVQGFIPARSVKSLQERFQKLVSKFKAQELQSLRDSGTDEEYSERLQLLTDIVEQLTDENFEEVDSIKKNNIKEQERQAKSIRDASLTTMTKKKPSNNPSNDTPKAMTVSELLRLSVQQQQADIDMRKDELKFRREELEAQKLERERDRELEKEKFEMLLTSLCKK